MAVAVTVVDKPSVFGERRVVIADLAFSSTYATGGEAVTPASLGLSRIDFVALSPMGAADAGTVGCPVKWDYSTNKIQFFENLAVAAADPLAEKTNAEAYVASTKLRILVFGI